MAKKEKRDHPKKNAAPDLMRKGDPRSLKDNPEGETVCSPYFSNGCVNEDMDPPAAGQQEDKNG